MSTRDELQATIAKLTAAGKGIVAADESLPTITKRFKAVGIESTDETRRQYRTLLFTAPGAEQFLAGVILFEETLGQNGDDGTPLPEVLSRRGILPGIKVDKGTVPLPGAEGDLVTQGLDGLGERLKTYKEKGKPAEGGARSRRARDARSAEADGSGGGSDDQFPVGWASAGRGDRESQRDERIGAARALGLVVLVRPRAAGRRDAHLGGSRRKCARRAGRVPQAREDE